MGGGDRLRARRRGHPNRHAANADLVVERVAALDLGKAGLEACVRVPNPQRPGRRMQELRGYATTTAQLLAMAGWLRHWHGHCQLEVVWTFS